MSVLPLRTPYTADGLRWTNFFNGRLLAGDDLGGDQKTVREAVRRLGQAVGGGVAFGLEVSGTLGGNSVTAPTVTVQPGLAVNAVGQTLALSNQVQISLVAGTGTDPTGSPAGGAFAGCGLPQDTVYVAGAGVYVLLIAPVQTQEGRAPVSGLGNAPAACAFKSNVDGVVFRLVQMRFTQPELADGAHLRNRAAYRWFGDPDGAAIIDPFGTGGVVPDELQRLNDLLLEPITDYDVPLAFIHWTSTSGIVWVDGWGPRRPLSPPHVAGDWPFLVDQRRWAAGLALSLQFQHQLESLRDGSAPSLGAWQAFNNLPAVGFLPLTHSGNAPGFSYLRFFERQTVRGPVYVEGARLGALLRWGLAFAPIPVRQQPSDPPPEFIWLYLVRENRQPVGSSPLGQPYVVFARGNIEYQGESRFNLSRWNYANFSMSGERTGP